MKQFTIDDKNIREKAEEIVRMKSSTGEMTIKDMVSSEMTSDGVCKANEAVINTLLALDSLYEEICTSEQLRLDYEKLIEYNNKLLMAICDIYLENFYDDDVSKAMDSKFPF